jgi:hypothetical protein
MSKILQLVSVRPVVSFRTRMGVELVFVNLLFVSVIGRSDRYSTKLVL